jgi:hypothetical protein
MYAGTLLRIDPVDEALTDEFNGQDRPALSVRSTQHDLADERPVQTGMAAAYTDETRQDVSIWTKSNANIEGDAEVVIETERVDTREQFPTEWVADVTGTGLIVPASVAGDGDLDFPLDLFYSLTGEQPERLAVDVRALAEAWDDDDVLGDPWAATSDHADGTEVQYGQHATGIPNNGLGFERPFGATALKGVVYRSGYVACYDASTATQFVRFLEEEVLPYTYVPEEDDQQTLTGGECEDCGRDVDELTDGLCMVCLDGREDEEVTA